HGRLLEFDVVEVESGEQARFRAWRIVVGLTLPTFGQFDCEPSGFGDVLVFASTVGHALTHLVRRSLFQGDAPTKVLEPIDADEGEAFGKVEFDFDHLRFQTRSQPRNFPRRVRDCKDIPFTPLRVVRMVISDRPISVATTMSFSPRRSSSRKAS